MGTEKIKEKLGHRRVSEEGTVTYKKKSTSELQKAIQLGINVSISSTERKSARDVLLKDFREIETFDFAKEGTHNLPAHKLSDFKFLSFAPLAFRFFRNVYQVDIVGFINSICVHDLRELSNAGASGSVFYITQDDEFIIKTVQHQEAEFLQKLLPEYFLNLTQHPRTLLPKFYGLYCYQSLGKNIRIVVMNNLIPSNIEIHEKYDLKGSTHKRFASAKEKAKKSPTLKDLDFREIHPKGLLLEDDTYNALVSTIDRDCRVLESFGIMDYSLLLAIHNLDEARREKSKNKAASLEVLSSPDGSDPAPFKLTSVSTQNVDNECPTSSASTEDYNALDKEARRLRAQAAWTRGVKRIAAFSTAMESIQATPKMMAHLNKEEAGNVPEYKRTENIFSFQEDEYSPGGIPARNAKGDRLLLFIGIIDILQNYRAVKKLEHAFKSILHDADAISVHHPSFYSSRFRDFLCDFVMHKQSGSTSSNSVSGNGKRSLIH